MAIPIGPIGGAASISTASPGATPAIPGDGEVMVAFHMFCHEDPQLAREIARPPFEEYFRALNEAAGDWERGTLQGLSRLRHLDAAAALVHARRPDRSGRRLGRHARRDQGDHPPRAWAPSASSSTPRCRSISARSTCARRRSRCGCSPREVMPEFAEATRRRGSPLRWRRRASPPRRLNSSHDVKQPRKVSHPHAEEHRVAMRLEA